ncbi:hypothetical protein CVT26_003364 [Gymnopilus dilepis]|uniref:Uncharacterized protein n=1 Tax=Gymnopilus dilepis TaxID=231916 RepID=A0A409VQJ5_9AGAR|nr:hypothetical protein CVT26_003364 [Gymnopilus dilepis]
MSIAGCWWRSSGLSLGWYRVLLLPFLDCLLALLLLLCLRLLHHRILDGFLEATDLPKAKLSINALQSNGVTFPPRLSTTSGIFTAAPIGVDEEATVPAERGVCLCSMTSAGDHAQTGTGYCDLSRHIIHHPLKAKFSAGFFLSSGIGFLPEPPTTFDPFSERDPPQKCSNRLRLRRSG